VDELVGSDAEDAGGPTLSGGDEEATVLPVGSGEDEVLRFVGDFGGDLAALGVETFDLVGEHGGGDRVVGEEEVEREVGVGRATGGGEAGGDAEGDAVGGDGGGVETGLLDEGNETGALLFVDVLETVADEGAVDAGKGRDVADGAEGDVI